MIRLARAALVLLLILPLAAFALDPAKSLFQFNCQNWSRLAGLPADKISAVTQTADGYIWLGSQNGLIRFDGLDFKVVRVDLPSAQGQDIRRLHRGSDGRLWFSIMSGGYGGFDGQAFHAIGDSRWNTPGANSNTILAAADGAIWTGSVFGWGRWSPGHPEQTYFDEQLGAVIALWQDRDGRVWLGSAERGLYYWESGELKLFPDENLKHRNIYAMAQDAEGDLWVGTSQGLYRYDAQFRHKATYFDNSQTNTLLIDSHGLFWVGTNDAGVARYQDGQFSFLRKADGLGSDQVNALFEDTEGSLWIATVEGVSQLTDLKFPIYSSHEGLLPGGAIDVAASPRGGLWAAMPTGASYFDGHTSTNHDDPALFPNRYVRRLFAARNGDVYFSDGNRNISLLRDGQLAAQLPQEQWTEAFAEDATGVIVGIGPSLHRIRDGRVEPFEFQGEVPYFDWFNTLRVTRDGALWAATNAGLFRIDQGRTRRWSTSEGLPANRVHTVFEDIDDSIWAGLPNGLVRLKGDRLTRITAEDGLSDARIYAITADDLGYLWMASGRGILRIARQNLTDFAEGRIARITCETYDGLESVKFIDRTDQAYSVAKTLDGRIWFPNPRGIVMIDPAHYATNRIPPRVYVEKVRVPGREFLNPQAASLEVNQRNVEFFFTALSYVAPKKIRIQYQLEGFDPGWIEAGARRSVVYNRLPPGRYTFRVQAANADGVWNRTGATCTIELPPPFYQRLWFYALGVTAVGCALIGGYQWKVRQLRTLQRKLKAENDLLESKVQQRTQELASSLALLKATLDSTADGIISVQFADQTISYNRQFAEMWRLPAERIGNIGNVELRAFTAAQVKDSAGFTAAINRNFAGPEAESFDVIELIDGRIFERYCKPQRMEGRSVGIVVNFRDITDRKRAEATIAEASALLESLLEHTLDVIYFKDRASRFVRYSRTILPLYGCTDRDALKGKSDFDLFPEEKAREFRAEEQTIIEQGRPLIDKLEKNIRPDGREVWIMTTKMPWRDLHGNIIGTFGVARDVTALKEAELRLAAERDLLTTLMEGSLDKIYFKDRDSRFLRCSLAQAQSSQVASVDDLVGKTDFDFFSADHARRAFDDEQTIIRTGRPLMGNVERETWLDGRVTWVLTSKMPLRNASGEIVGTFGISKDITKLKEAEAKLEEVNRQLLETSRHAGMAEVATSVLHNVGNVLNSVNVSATLVAEQMRESKTGFVARIGGMLQAHLGDLGRFLTEDPKGRKIPAYLATLGEELLDEQRVMIEELGHLRRNIEHIKEIVAMQQNFAKVSGVAEPVALAELVDDALRINASALTRHEVGLVRDYQVRPVLTIERHKVMQVLVNLIRNAKYACDEGVQGDKRMIVRLSQHADRVRIAVIDNGVGIPPGNLTRIFAHGFTTRKDGHGFGLHSGALVARELGGSLTAHSDGPGLGATFTFELPLDPPHPPGP